MHIAKRYPLPLPVKIRQGLSKECVGLAQNISKSGIWVERCAIQPIVGAPIRVQLLLFEGNRGLALRAEVVRHTESGGFAARFTSLDQRMQRSLEAVLEGLADQSDDDDDGPPTITRSLALRLEPDVCELLSRIAKSERMDPADLLRECALQGLLKFDKRRISVQPPD